ncbi:MAG: hypothetical protein R3Y68_01345 [Rikenellaceae bacterium]
MKPIFYSLLALLCALTSCSEAAVDDIVDLLAPTSFTAERASVGSDIITFDWAAVEGAEGYELWANNALVAYVDSAELSITIENAAVEQTIYFVCAVTDGYKSEAAMVTVDAQIVIPSAPSSFNAVRKDFAIVFSWDAVDGADTYEITDYDGVSIYSGADLNYLYEFAPTLSSTYHLYASNVIGTSNGKSVVVAEKLVAPDAPTSFAGVRNDLAIEFSWDEVAGASYEIRVKGETDVVASVVAGTFSYIYDNAPTEATTFEIYAIKSLLYSESAAEVTVAEKALETYSIDDNLNDFSMMDSYSGNLIYREQKIWDSASYTAIGVQISNVGAVAGEACYSNIIYKSEGVFTSYEVGLYYAIFAAGNSYTLDVCGSTDGEIYTTIDSETYDDVAHNGYNTPADQGLTILSGDIDSSLGYQYIKVVMTSVNEVTIPFILDYIYLDYLY